MSDQDKQGKEQRRLYWRNTQRLTLVLLAVWFLMSFVTTYFARELSFKFFGWPFSFWLGAQGIPLGYGLIIGFYAWAMNRLDVKHGQDEDAD
jgi:putative solute:sodium symporter small subunit